MGKTWQSRLKRIAVGAVVAVLAGYGGYLGFVFYSFHTHPVTGFRDGSMWIRNCEEPRDENAEGLCPLLYCEKGIRESGRLRGAYELRSVFSRLSSEGAPIVHDGAIEYAEAAGGQALKRFICKTQGIEVLSFDLLTEEAWSEMVQSGKVRDY